MQAALFSDTTNRILLGASAISMSSAPVFGSKALEVAGTVISTLATTLTMAKDRRLVQLDHPVLATHLTTRESAHKANVLSVEVMQTRLSTLQMAFEEYHSGFQTARATADVVYEQNRKMQSLLSELNTLTEATQNFFTSGSKVAHELEQCRAALNASVSMFPPSTLANSTIRELLPACSGLNAMTTSTLHHVTPIPSMVNNATTMAPAALDALPTATASMKSAIPVACFTDNLKLGLAAYTCLNVGSKFQYFQESGWNPNRAVNFIFEAVRAAADVSSAMGYPLPPVADLAITMGVYGTRFFIDQTKTDLQRLNEQVKNLPGKTNRELFEASKEYISSIAKMEIALLRRVKQHHEQEGTTTSPEYINVLNQINEITKLARFGNGEFNRKKSIANTKQKLDQLIETNQAMIAQYKNASTESASLARELESLTLILDSLVGFNQEFSACAQANRKH